MLRLGLVIYLVHLKKLIMNFKILAFLLLFSFIAVSHEINIEDKNVEEIVKQRMSNMSKIKAYSTKMYPLTMSGEFEEIKELNDKLLHAAQEFKLLFAEGTQGGKASSLIWEDREKFDLFNDNFISSIENIGKSINNEDSVSLVENFNIMASNCGTCHKKFRN